MNNNNPTYFLIKAITLLNFTTISKKTTTKKYFQQICFGGIREWKERCYLKGLHYKVAIKLLKRNLEAVSIEKHFISLKEYIEIKGKQIYPNVMKKAESAERIMHQEFAMLQKTQRPANQPRILVTSEITKKSNSVESKKTKSINKPDEKNTETKKIKKDLIKSSEIKVQDKKIKIENKKNISESKLDKSNTNFISKDVLTSKKETESIKNETKLKDPDSAKNKSKEISKKEENQNPKKENNYLKRKVESNKIGSEKNSQTSSNNQENSPSESSNFKEESQKNIKESSPHQEKNETFENRKNSNHVNNQNEKGKPSQNNQVQPQQQKKGAITIISELAQKLIDFYELKIEDRFIKNLLEYKEFSPLYKPPKNGKI